jgi:predicted permease
MTRSITAVALGVLIALAIGLLVVFGIFAPVFTALFGMEMAASTAVPTAMLVFAAAFSFYFGGMAASYMAPARRRLHGVLVALVAFVLSPLINLATGQAMFPGVDDPVTVLLAALFLCVSLAAAYIGARRGDALFAYNQRMKRRAPR